VRAKDGAVATHWASAVERAFDQRRCGIIRHNSDITPRLA
jgi:hypothetical protein